MGKINIFLSAALFLIFAQAATEAKTVEVKSPSGEVCVKIEDGARLNYSVFLDGKPLLENCAISMQTDKGDWGANAKIKSAKQSIIDKTEDAPL